MPAGAGKQLNNSFSGDRPAGGAKALGDEDRERLALYRPQLDRLGAAPERLVSIVEDLLHDVALAAEVDMGNLGLLLKDGAQ